VVRSLEVQELSARRLVQELSSQAAAGLAPTGPAGVEAGLPAPAGVEAGGVSSPEGGRPEWPTGFRLSVNAELVIYGATEPTANLVIGGRVVPLRPDGTFSFRFSLPDGDYELAVTATSTQDERRGAVLKFSRCTEHEGQVAAHPQDPSLKPPSVEDIA